MSKLMKIISIVVFLSICCIVVLYFWKMSENKTTTEEMREGLTEAAKAISEYTVDQRDEAVQTIKVELDNIDKNISSLEKKIDEKWEKMDDTAQEHARKTLLELREKRERVGEWFGGLKHGSKEAWEDTKKGFSDSYRKLQDAWKKAKEEFGK